MIHTSLDILKCLDKVTDVTLMTSTDDTKLGNAAFIFKDNDVKGHQIQQHQ